MEGPQKVTAWKHWLESEEGKGASNPFTLPPGENARQYLKNRLETAFQAGIRAAEKHEAEQCSTDSQSVCTLLDEGMGKDPRDEGSLCQRCERRYKVDLRFDDELWNRIHEGHNLLCPACIAELIEDQGEFAYYDLKIPDD